MGSKNQKLNIRGMIQKLLVTIPSKNREVLERRFGLVSGSPETLESVGVSYKITRERVRQIQEYGLKKIMQANKADLLYPIFDKITAHIDSKGGVISEADLFSDLVKAQDAPQFSLILKLSPGLIYARETDDLNTRYGLSKEVLEEADGVVSRVHQALRTSNATLSLNDLTQIISNEAKKGSARFGSPSAVENILSLSRRFKKGPFGDYGLDDWASISPRGVRDKAHLVFEREQRPLHFREISALIDKHFSVDRSRATHPQTVHNELIKDRRFVLIGRGLYALSEWGYEPGTVKDVLVQILKESNKALNKDELFEIIAERRFVKPNTVFLNLQNKNYFKKVEEGKYYLA